MPNVCVLLAEGFEEIEAVTVIDVLRRADIDVATVGVSDVDVTGSHGITIHADRTLGDDTDGGWDLVVLPGGMPGASNLRDDDRVQALVRAQYDRGGRVAAICAAPIALARAGLLENRTVTSYPSFAAKLGPVRYSEAAVVVDDRITTSRGPATAMRFALELVAQLRGTSRAQQLASGMLVSDDA
jgi:4-methyl-5(b-hydroxyethyl)-thiazole monophosphate biosynthesis